MKNLCSCAIKNMGALLVVVFVLVACGGTTLSLKEAKILQKEEKFSEIEKIELSCKPDKDGCNQLHLIKGDACFRLAKKQVSNTVKKQQLDCAVTEIFYGIDITKDWNAIDTDRGQYYENGLEAARLRADFGERNKYEGLLKKYAAEYEGFSPNTAGARYFNARANYFSLLSASRCASWQTLDASLQTDAQRFSTDNRYAAAFNLLLQQVKSETQTACQ